MLIECDIGNPGFIFHAIVREPKLWETSSVIYEYSLISAGIRKTPLFLKLKYYIGDKTDYGGMSVF